MLTAVIANLLSRRNLPVYLLLFVVGFSGCFRSNEKKESFEFDFTHSTIFEAFAMKYTGNDTLFVREYWSQNRLTHSPVDYFQKVSREDLNKLTQLVNDIDLLKLDTLYPTLGPLDEPFYGVYLRKGNLSKTAYGQT